MRMLKSYSNIRARTQKKLTDGNRILRAGRASGRPFISSLFRLIWMYGVRRFSLREIEGYDLLHATTPMRPSVSKQESVNYLKKVNPKDYRCLTENKIVFDAMCRARGLPVPKCYAIFAAGKAVRPVSNRGSADSDDVQLPSEFIIKPADGSYGQLVTGWRRVGETWKQQGGEDYSYTTEQLLARFKKASQRRSWIVQEQMRSHPSIAQVSGFDSVQCCRVVTLRDPGHEGKVEVLSGSIKMLGKESVTDNFFFGHGGNLLCPVDIRKGSISSAMWRDPASNRLARCERHPLTGLEIQGFQIPYWAEILELVRRAADVFFVSPAIGWDIAVTSEGPVLIEGNVGWDPPFDVGHEIWKRLSNIGR